MLALTRPLSAQMRLLTVMCGMCLGIAALLISFSGCSDDPTPSAADGGTPGDAGREASFDSRSTDTQSPVDSALDLPADSMLADRTLVPTDGGWDADPRPWQVAVVDDSPKFKSRVDVAADPTGQPRLAYNIATSADGWDTPDIWLAYESSSAWTKALAVPAQGTSREFPTVIVDAQDRVHIFYSQYLESESQVDLFYTYTDDRQTFATPQNLTASVDIHEYAPAVALDGQGVFHLLFQRLVGSAGYTVGYLQLANGQPSPVEVIANPTVQFSISPDYAIAVESTGVVYAVYSKPGDNPLLNVLYLKSRTSSWQDEHRVTDTAKDVWGPAMGVDANGVVHLAYSYGPDWDHKTLTYNRFQNGAFVGEQALTTSDKDRSYYLGLAVEADGTVHIAFSRYYQPNPSISSVGDIFYLKGKNGIFFPEERITDTPDLDESYPGIALGANNRIFISFNENTSKAPDGMIYLAAKK